MGVNKVRGLVVAAVVGFRAVACCLSVWGGAGLTERGGVCVSDGGREAMW
jgi:hypothetical protein